MTQKSEQAKRVSNGNQRCVKLCVVGVVLIAVTLVAYLCWDRLFAVPEPDTSKLVGRWVRVDGGYVLELSSPGPDGVLKAAYSNPRPIHVAQAQWKEQGDVLGVFIELRDQGYPGSTYTLNYHLAEDCLVGTYYQAALGQHFEVAFKRKK